MFKFEIFFFYGTIMKFSIDISMCIRIMLTSQQVLKVAINTAQFMHCFTLLEVSGAFPHFIGTKTNNNC